MKLLLIGLAAALSAPSSALATVLNIGTVEQPVNLGPRADPARIPLGPVVVESNHGYGVHAVISEPRPCTHGAIAWERGLELNMNLASVFGIEVSPDDETQVPQLPVTINVKDWPAPPYSPYRKEQVLAATLQCLLRSVRATPLTPLKVVINAANPEDARNLGGFAGTYLTAEAEDLGGPTPVPGTRLETDWRGVTSVVFTDLPPPRQPPAVRPPSPVLIPFYIPDETDELSFELLPVWAGDTWAEDPRELLPQPITLFYDRFDTSQSSGPDINALTRLGILSQWHWKDEVDGSQLTFRVHKPDGQAEANVASTLAAFCHAAVFTTHPTTERPLTLRFQISKDLQPAMAAFTKSDDWKSAKAPKGETILSCQFVWDSEARTLRKGAIPLGELTAGIDRPWSITFAPGQPELAPPADPANPPAPAEPEELPGG